jgi:hypothetical protein
MFSIKKKILSPLGPDLKQKVTDNCVKKEEERKKINDFILYIIFYEWS